MFKEKGKNLSNIIFGNTALINQKVSQLSEQNTKNNECLDKSSKIWNSSKLVLKLNKKNGQKYKKSETENVKRKGG